MSDEVALIARAFVIGVAVAAPVGAIGVLCIQRTLERGWRAGMATGTGVATADGIYAAVAAFGLTAISATLVAWQAPLRIVGGGVLIALGIRALLARGGSAAASSLVASPAEGVRTETATRPASAAGSYFSAVGLTLANPTTIVAFGAIFAGAGLAVGADAADAALATFGVAAGSLSWWLVLVTGVSLARRAIGPRFLTRLNAVSGGALVVLGLLAVGSAFVG